MTQRLVWPADLQRQEDGSILVSFPDIPEALTEGATEAEALVEAQDCVIAALGGYVEGRHPIPAPSPVRGRTSVALPVLVAAKIALYGAMHEQGVGNTALAERQPRTRRGLPGRHPASLSRRASRTSTPRWARCPNMARRKPLGSSGITPGVAK